MLKLCTKEAGEVREEGTETILMQYNTTNGFILTKSYGSVFPDRGRAEQICPKQQVSFVF